MMSGVQKSGAGGLLIPRGPQILLVDATPASCSSTGVDEVLSSVVIPAGLLGPNAILRIEPAWIFSNSANAKIVSVKTAGGVTLFSRTRTTSASETPLIVAVNRGAVNSQVYPYAGPTNGTAGYQSAGSIATLETTAIDFSASQTINIIGQRGNGADTLRLDYVMVSVWDQDS